MNVKDQIDIGFLDILNVSECKNVSRSVDSLSDIWHRAGSDLGRDHFFYSLGSSSYIDGEKSKDLYHANASVTNKILFKNFHHVYDKIVMSINQNIGESILSPHLAYPGFHIFGAPSGRKVTGRGLFIKNLIPPAIHKDIPHQHHHDTWKRFDNVDLSQTLSFTLPVELPVCGGGLVIHDDLDEKMLDKIKIPRDTRSPFVVEYTIGKMIYHIGDITHQILKRTEFRSHDRRITLQGHGVKCDNVWQLYF